MPRPFDSSAATATVGAQALDFAISSAQQVTDNADRLVRAMAGSQLAPADLTGSGAQRAWPALSGPWEVATQFQRASFQFGLNAWVAWVSALGGLASAAVGRSMQLAAAEPQTWPPALPSLASATTRRAATAGRQDRSGGAVTRAFQATERAVAASGSKRQRPAARSAAKNRSRKK